MVSARTSRAWGQYAWLAGVLFVIAVVAESVVSTGLEVTQNDSAGKIARALHEHRERLLVIAYISLYLMTFALDSVGDLFGSLSAFAAGLLVTRSGVLPRWLGWVPIIAGIFLFLQAFGLGGVIASFGLALDLIGFVLFLVFVLVSSVILLRHETASRRSALLG